jgi:propionate CoA-transferase
MDFRPTIKGPPRLMDARIFQPEPMGLKEDLLTLTLAERLTYDAEENLFLVNFEGYAVKTSQQVEDIKNAVVKIVAPLNQKVYTISICQYVTSNYDDDQNHKNSGKR